MDNARPLEASRYVSLTKYIIHLYGHTTADLKSWWRSEESTRAMYGIVKGTPEFDDLWECFVRKGKALRSKEERGEG